jgi:hypothetical protein
MVRIEIGPGEIIEIGLRDTDGVFTVTYGDQEVTVHADLPDSTGRAGIIYSENSRVDKEIPGAEIDFVPMKRCPFCRTYGHDHRSDCPNAGTGMQHHVPI